MRGRVVLNLGGLGSGVPMNAFLDRLPKSTYNDGVPYYTALVAYSKSCDNLPLKGIC
jgi:hypothetical protein